MPENTDTDATHLLAQDHRTVEKLFSDYESAKDLGRKRDIAAKICTELTIHAMIEEEIFYPALRGKIEDDLLDEAYVEHDGAKVLIKELESGGPDEEFYDAKMTVLQEEIEHHVKEEEKERDNMFQQARATDVDLDDLGRQMITRKDELKKMAEEGSLPEPTLTTM